MDIKFKTENWNFKFRVCGIIVQDGKYLVMKIDDATYFHIPGGHIEFGENTHIAVCREAQEEIGCEVEIKSLFCVEENIYTKSDERYQEIAFYYLLTPKEKLSIENFKKIENDKGKIKNLEFCWFDANQLKDINLKPLTVKNMIIENRLNEFTHSINAD